LRYVSENRGWGRPYDLIDHQDGPYYLTDWEPGYPNEVTVELAFAAPVRANALWVAQNPYREVSGSLQFAGSGIDGTPFAAEITLAGTGGWRSVDLSPPTIVDRFTITRSAAETNVVELLVCIAP